MPVRKVAAVKGHGKWVLAWHRHSCLCGFSLLGGHEDKILVEQFGIGELLSGMGGGLRRTARNGRATKTGAEFRMLSNLS